MNPLTLVMYPLGLGSGRWRRMGAEMIKYRFKITHGLYAQLAILSLNVMFALFGTYTYLQLISAFSAGFCVAVLIFNLEKLRAEKTDARALIQLNHLNRKKIQELRYRAMALAS